MEEQSLLANIYNWLFVHFDPFWIVAFGTFFIHLFLYFGIYSLYFFAEKTPSLQKYKIQQDKQPTPDMRWNCFIKLLASDVFPQLPLMILTYPTLTYLGSRVDPPFPSWTEMGFQVSLFFILEDSWFYWVHRLLHWGPFYKYIHKIHHEHNVPFGMAAEYAHPIETRFVGFWNIFRPINIFATSCNTLGVAFW